MLEVVVNKKNYLIARGREKMLTKTETEFVAWLDVVLVKVAVVDEEVPGCVVAGCDCRAVVGRLLGDRVGKFTAGGGGAVKDIYETVAGLLALSVCVSISIHLVLWQYVNLPGRPAQTTATTFGFSMYGSKMSGPTLWMTTIVFLFTAATALTRSLPLCQGSRFFRSPALPSTVM